MFITHGRLIKTRYAGSACSGTDGATNRTLTAARPLLSDSLIYINRAMMHPTDDYTTSGAVITFLNNIDNTDAIVVMT
jgi:hypothetical protein